MLRVTMMLIGEYCRGW